MHPRPGLANLGEAVVFVRTVAARRDWRFEVLRQRSGRLVFEVYDSQTYCSSRFQIRSDGDGTHRVVRSRFSRRPVFGWRLALVGFLVLVWLGIDRQDATIQSNPGETLGARYGDAIAQLARLALILVAVVALLVLVILTFRPSRRRARRLARTRLRELTAALTERPD